VSALFVHVIERNVFAYRRMWLIFVAGFAEPFLFLLSIGVGVGSLVGTLTVGGQTVEYDEFVAPGLLAAAAMNGAAFDATFNFFFKFKWAKTFDAMLSTPIGTLDIAFGELGWSMVRGTVYSGTFLAAMVVLGLTASPWAILCLPAAMLIGFAFAGAGMGATTFMRSFVDFDYVNIILLPLFLFSATFFPISQYPAGLQWIVRCTPLYQGVALCRGLAFGEFSWTMLVNVAYLAVLGFVGVRIAGHRLQRLLQP
jgi:lipooligosaccharide transport system permease protein